MHWAMCSNADGCIGSGLSDHADGLAVAAPPGARRMEADAVDARGDLVRSGDGVGLLEHAEAAEVLEHPPRVEHVVRGDPVRSAVASAVLEEVFDDVQTARLQTREQAPERDLLVVRLVASVV